MFYLPSLKDPLLPHTSFLTSMGIPSEIHISSDLNLVFTYKKKNQCLLIWVWFTSLRMIASNSINLPLNFIFLKVYHILNELYFYFLCNSMNIKVVSLSWLL